MVGQSLKDVNPKQVKLAKQVLAIFEVMGISEEALTELANIADLKPYIDSKINEAVKPLRKEIDCLKNELEEKNIRIAELEEFRESAIRVQKNEAKGETANKKSLSEIINENFNQGVEEFTPYGKK